MTAILKEKEVLDLVNDIDIISSIEQGFIQYSTGQVIVPPVGELLFSNPEGEAHIKYGYIKDDEYYCIKIASGFYGNRESGISSSQGMMLLFSQQTGEPLAVLLDGGKLTDLRTAAAGAVAAKYYAPKNVSAIGIIGTGIQGRLQLQYLKNIIDCKKILIWDLYAESANSYIKELGSEYDISKALDPKDIAEHCKLIITTSPSNKALLYAEHIKPGTHITAVGSDTSEKQELDSNILCKADIVISDSIEQSMSRGEIFKARSNKDFDPEKIIELGSVITKKDMHRRNNEQITVVDLTGVAVQDIMIASAVYRKYLITNK